MGPLILLSGCSFMSVAEIQESGTVQMVFIVFFCEVLYPVLGMKSFIFFIHV
jgi:hypothetical protein